MNGPLWWDRDFDEYGNPIRADVRQAGHEIWQACCARTLYRLGDAAEAPELMEAAVAYISRYLNRAELPPPPGRAKRLLGLHFSQLLHKEAAKLRRFELVGISADLDRVAPILDCEWGSRVDLRLDFEKLRPFLGARHITMFTMRRLGHPWEEIAYKLGMETNQVRLDFWQAMRRARSVIESKGKDGDEV
jgi:hypothetical protein